MRGLAATVRRPYLPHFFPCVFAVSHHGELRAVREAQNKDIPARYGGHAKYGLTSHCHDILTMSGDHKEDELNNTGPRPWVGG